MYQHFSALKTIQKPNFHKNHADYEKNKAVFMNETVVLEAI